jgi:hypothetical protein
MIPRIVVKAVHVDDDDDGLALEIALMVLERRDGNYGHRHMAV